MWKRKMISEIKPIITETTMNLAKNGWYTFRVSLDRNKNELRKSISKTFKVDIVGIKTLVVKGKVKRSLKTRAIRKRSDWKKVIVKLKSGQKIEAFEVGA